MHVLAVVEVEQLAIFLRERAECISRRPQGGGRERRGAATHLSLEKQLLDLRHFAPVLNPTQRPHHDRLRSKVAPEERRVDDLRDVRELLGSQFREWEVGEVKEFRYRGSPVGFRGFRPKGGDESGEGLGVALSPVGEVSDEDVDGAHKVLGVGFRLPLEGDCDRVLDQFLKRRRDGRKNARAAFSAAPSPPSSSCFDESLNQLFACLTRLDAVVRIDAASPSSPPFFFAGLPATETPSPPASPLSSIAARTLSRARPPNISSLAVGSTKSLPEMGSA